MPAFRYRALHASGRIQKGQLTAANENELANFLRESDLELIEAAPHQTLSLPTQKRLPSLQQRATLCSQLEDLLRAGMPFLMALQTVTATMPMGPFRDSLLNIVRDLNNGSTIANAFAQFPHLFNPVFIAILTAGETGGDLDQTFGYLAGQLRRQARLREQLSRALRYPLFLLAIAFGVTTFMLAVVVPQVVDFLLSISATLPLPTRLLIGTSQLFTASWWVLLSLLIFLISSTVIARRFSEKAAFLTDTLFLKLPKLGEIVRKSAVARFTHSLTLLLQNGLDLPSSLRVATNALGNRALIATAREAEKNLLAGQPLSAALAGLFPSFVLQMLRVGEQSGQLPKVLEEVSRAMDEDIQTTIERFIGTLEPALTLLVGALLAWVVLAVLGPVYSGLGRLGQVPQ